MSYITETSGSLTPRQISSNISLPEQDNPSRIALAEEDEFPKTYTKITNLSTPEQ